MNDAPSCDVLVVGGGVAGLTCAVLLSSHGLRVTVLESDDRCGGRASSGVDTHTGDTVDIGPHVLSTEHRNFLSLLRRLGTDHEVHWQPDPLITLLDAGEQLHMTTHRWPAPLHALPNLPRALRRVSWRDLLSNTRIGWQAARLNEARCLALDDRDALTHLRLMGVSERFIDWFWASAVLALLNVPLQQCSAAALMRMARLLAGISGAHFGFPRVGLADLFVPGATKAIEAAGGRVLMNRCAERIVCRDGGFAAIECADGERFSASVAVLALPPQALAALPLGDGPHPPWQRLAEQFQPCPYVSTMLWFDRPLSTRAFWARPWCADDLNTDFYDLARLRSAPLSAPSVVAANAIHAMQVWQHPDEALIAQTQAEVAQFAPEAAQARLLHARVHRIEMAVPCPRPGTERARPANATEVAGLWLAGDWTATHLPCSMESAARSGSIAAEAVAAHLGRPARWTAPLPETGGLMGLLRER